MALKVITALNLYSGLLDLMGISENLEWKNMGCMRARILKMEGMKMSTTNRGQAAPVAAHIALCQASKPQQAPSESPSHRMVHLTRCAATLEQVFAPPQRAPSGTYHHHHHHQPRSISVSR